MQLLIVIPWNSDLISDKESHHFRPKPVSLVFLWLCVGVWVGWNDKCHSLGFWVKHFFISLLFEMLLFIGNPSTMYSMEYYLLHISYCVFSGGSVWFVESYLMAYLLSSLFFQIWLLSSCSLRKIIHTQVIVLIPETEKAFKSPTKVAALVYWPFSWNFG